MEREQSTETLIALGITAVIFIIVLILVVVISAARRNSSRKAILKLLNNQSEAAVRKLENEISHIKGRLEILEKND